MINRAIDSIIHWAHWINWNAIGHCALVLFGALLIAIELYLLDANLERNIQKGLGGSDSDS